MSASIGLTIGRLFFFLCVTYISMSARSYENPSEAHTCSRVVLSVLSLLVLSVGARFRLISFVPTTYQRGSQGKPLKQVLQSLKSGQLIFERRAGFREWREAPCSCGY